MASSFRIDVIIINTLLNIFLYYNCLNIIPHVQSSRADLGTYLHIAPAVEEKSPEDLYVLAFINYTYIDDGREVYYSEEKGRYGEGKILNVQGFLEHITSSDDYNDHTACTINLRGTNGNPLPPLGTGKPWIALIRRGKCTFEEKIKYAWKHGAVGVIVYNEIPAVSLEKMKIIEKDRNITAIFTYKWIGEELGRIVDGGNHIWVSISEGQRGMKPQHNINNFTTKIMNLISYTRHLFALNGTSVLFVSISFIVLMIISLVWLIFYYIQRFRYLQSKDQHSRHLCAVAKRVIMKIPTKSGKSNDDKDSENDCCAICIEPYKATDCIRVLPCNHEFHKNCIDPWLLEHRTCPMCKLDVLKHYGFVYIGSEESILQLDLDMEIGDHGLNSGGDDDRFSIDNNSRINHIPTFHIQNFDDHSHLVRNLSFEITHQIHHADDLPERSQSSLSCINRMLDEAVTNKLFAHNQQQLQQQQQNRNNQSGTSSNKDGGKDSKNNTMKFNNFLSPDCYKKDKESVSLPGTLKKKRSTDSCRGSNNCYIKAAAADLKQLAAKIEKGCPKSRTGIVRQASDDEHLLDNMNDNSTEMTEVTSASTKKKKVPSSSSSNSKNVDMELQTTVVGSTLESETRRESSHSTATTETVPSIAIVPPQKIQNETEQPTSGRTAASSSSSSKQKP